MTDQDKKTEPWGETFKADQPDQYSRTEHRKKNRRVSWTIGVLVIVVIALSFVPIYEYLQTLNKPTNAEQTWSSASTSSTKITDSSNSKSMKESSKAAAESKSKKSEEAKSKAKQAEAESKAKADSKEKAEKAASKANAAKQQSAQHESNRTSNSNGKQYMTVDAGQGIYRIATNAGITEAKLKELNPDVNFATMHAGQRLRVK